MSNAIIVVVVHSGDLPSVASSGGHSSGSDDSKGPDERCPPPVAFYTPNPVITLMIGELAGFVYRYELLARVCVSF